MSTLLVLAAGMGSRYGGLKQLDAVGPNGEFLLDYSVFDAIRAGFEKVVFVIRRDFEDEFRLKVGARYDGRIAVDYAFQDLRDLPGNRQAPVERVKPWGTGHAIWSARDKVTTPFLTVNADDFYGIGAYRAMNTFFREHWQPGRGALVAYQLDRTISENGSVSRGVCQTDANDRLTKVEECTDIRRDEQGAIAGVGSDGTQRSLKGSEWVSMNFWGLGPEVFSELGELFGGFLDQGGLANLKSEFYIPTAVTDLIVRQRLEVSLLQTWDNWYGMTYREDRDTVAAALLGLVGEGTYPRVLEINQ